MFVESVKEQISEYRTEIDRLSHKIASLIDFSSTPLLDENISIDADKQNELERIVNKLHNVSKILKNIEKELLEEIR